MATIPQTHAAQSQYFAETIENIAGDINDTTVLQTIQQRLKQSIVDGIYNQAQHDFNKVLRLFSEGCNLRITLTCLNILALMVYHRGASLIKQLSHSYQNKLSMAILNLDVTEILKINPKIESSLIYLISSVSAVLNSCRFKNVILEFFRKCSSSSKTNYNCLKLISELQTKSQLTDKDFKRQRIAQNIAERLENQSVELHKIAYIILVRQGYPTAAANIFQTAVQKIQSVDKKAELLSKFLSVMSCYPDQMSIDILYQVNKVIACIKVNPPLCYLRALIPVLPQLSKTLFYGLLEGGLLRSFDCRWDEIKCSEYQRWYFELQLRILDIGYKEPYGSLYLQSLVLGKFGENFKEAVKGCNNKDVYLTLKNLYVKYLNGLMPETI